MSELFERMAKQNREFNEEIQKSKCIGCDYHYEKSCLSKDGCTGGTEEEEVQVKEN